MFLIANIELTRGDTLALHIDLMDDNGEPYTLKDGDDLVLTIKKSTRTPDVILQKHGQDVVIEPDDTEPLKYGTYKYDVQLTLADGRVTTVIKPSDFILGEEVTW